MVRTGESIEVAIKSGRIDAGENTRKTFKKKNSEVNTTGSYNLPKNFTISTPITTRSEQGAVKKDSRIPRKENEKVSFTPLPISYDELYTQLYKADLVRPYIVAPFHPPFPAWYDEKARCDYHGGVLGHSIENYTAFKKVAQNLIKAGVLKFDNPNVAANPLPNHEGRGVNLIEGDCVRKTKGSILEVTAPMRWVFRHLCMARLIDRGMVVVHEGSGPYCEYHQEEGYDIQL
ncbi:hypothetical protein V6N12_010489 [Hibiscus sabdariffa]|uniref:Uncharacterized protein n=1 Tax=Hibiscus sabdariffa TaxID=183260 RepID=A0ABR2EK90_9ROSI